MSMTPQDVADAASGLAGVARRTPLLSAPAVDDLLRRHVLVKAENMQLSGSFKLRGAYTALSRMSDAQRRRGVIGASSGNHGWALSLVAQRYGVPATVVVPHDSPAVKRDGMSAHGARLVSYRRGTDDRDAIVAQHADDLGLSVVPSANSEAVIAGAGTAAWEMLADEPDLVAIVVPVGGGGLAAGTALAAAGHHARTVVIGVEPRSADDTRRSLAAGRPVRIPAPVTVADGLGHTEPAPIPWEINRRLLHDVVTVSDEAIADAMAHLWRHYRSVAEPSAATAFAGLLACHDRLPPGPVGVVLSGGNIDWPTYYSLVNPAVERTEQRTRAAAVLC